jgi:nicotinamidase-related amidase
MITLDSRTTALVLIDLQKGLIGRPLAPRSFDEVVKTSMELAARFRQAGAPVVLVNVAFAPDFGDAPKQQVDKPFAPPPGGFPANFSELLDGLAHPADIRVTKHQWGAFYGTDLDVQLRRRGIKTVVLGGVATNMGVESTARQAWERSYELVIPEDTTASLSPEMHAFSINEILPRLGRVTRAADIELRKD